MFLSPGKDSLIFAVTNLIVWGHQRKIRDLAPQRKKSILRVWLSQLFPTCPDLMSYHISSLIVRLYHFFSGYLQVYKYSCPVVPNHFHICDPSLVVTLWGISTFISTLQIRQLKVREIKGLIQVYTGSMWQSSDTKLVLGTSDYVPFPLTT